MIQLLWFLLKLKLMSILPRVKCRGTMSATIATNDMLCYNEISGLEIHVERAVQQSEYHGRVLKLNPEQSCQMQSS